MRRAGKNRAGAVVHQNEIRDPDRQFPIRVQRVFHLDTRVKAQFFASFDGLFGGATLATLGDKIRDLWVFGLKLFCNRVIR